MEEKGGSAKKKKRNLVGKRGGTFLGSLATGGDFIIRKLGIILCTWVSGRPSENAPEASGYTPEAGGSRGLGMNCGAWWTDLWAWA